MTAGDAGRAPGRLARPGRARRARWLLLAVSGLVAAALALPLVFLLIEAHGAGAAELAHLIFRPLTGSCCGTRSGSPWRSPRSAR